VTGLYSICFVIEEPRPKAHAVYVVATTAMARVAVGRLSIDGAPLSKLAFRVPVPKITGDDAFDLHADDQKFRVIDMMEKNAPAIAKIHGFMSSKQLATVGAERASARGGWTFDYDALSRIPLEWMAEHLVWRAVQLKREQAEPYLI
jgi:hypothetical protein